MLNFFNKPPAPQTPENDAEKAQPARVLDEVYEWAEAVCFSLTLIVILFTFIFRIVGVQGVSMKNTLNPEAVSEQQTIDRLIISPLWYTPHQRDIVVLSTGAFPQPIIKRVIAVGGQTVDIDFQRHIVMVNGRPITENYISTPTSLQGNMTFPVTVPKGYVFVMGDNRNQSHDSRWKDIGLVDERHILGKAVFRIFPLNQIGILH